MLGGQTSHFDILETMGGIIESEQDCYIICPTMDLFFEKEFHSPQQGDRYRISFILP